MFYLLSIFKKLILLICLICLCNVITLQAHAFGYNLSNCLDKPNCFFLERFPVDLEENYQDLVNLANEIPKTILLEKSDSYSHWLVKSLVFNFPDDLELLKNTEQGSIQIKSSSRLGKFAFGVNKRRVERLLSLIITACY